MNDNIQQHNGSIGELKVAVDLMEKGFDVYIPMNRHSQCDLVAVDPKRNVFRVEVKSFKVCQSQTCQLFSKNKLDVLAQVYDNKIVYIGHYNFGHKEGERHE